MRRARGARRRRARRGGRRRSGRHPGGRRRNDVGRGSRPTRLRRSGRAASRARLRRSSSVAAPGVATRRRLAPPDRSVASTRGASISVSPSPRWTPAPGRPRWTASVRFAAVLRRLLRLFVRGDGSSRLLRGRMPMHAHRDRPSRKNDRSGGWRYPRAQEADASGGGARRLRPRSAARWTGRR